MDEIVRLSSLMLLMIGWLLMAATARNHSWARSLFILAAGETLVRASVVFFNALGLRDFGAELLRSCLTPALIVLVVGQFAIMYRSSEPHDAAGPGVHIR